MGNDTLLCNMIHLPKANIIKKGLHFREVLFSVSRVQKRTGEKPLILLGLTQIFFTNIL